MSERYRTSIDESYAERLARLVQVGEVAVENGPAILRAALELGPTAVAEDLERIRASLEGERSNLQRLSDGIARILD